MKTEHKILFFRYFILTSLSLSVVLSGIVAFSLFTHAGSANYSSNQFLFAFLNTLLLILAITAIHFFIKSFFHKVSSEAEHIDELTGFMTRHAFGQFFEHVVLDTKRSRTPLSILLIDIDHFRFVNEKHGHRVGDELITILAKSVQSVLRASDITCRWNGDQILVALKDCTEKDGCNLAEKMLVKIREQELITKEKPVTFTASIGVSQMIAGDDKETLVTRAETGLYSARNNGRNSFAIGYEWILIDYACRPIF